MSLVNLFFGRDSRATTRRRPRSFRPGLQPRLEGLEDRTVLSAAGGSATVMKAPPTSTTAINILPQLKVTDVTVVGNTLNAVIALGDQTINQAITLGTTPSTVAGADCPILNLELGPIHLDLLGLNVDTSAICLAITAHEGEGLLGDLLCGLSDALGSGLNLTDFLGGLTADQVGSLLGGVEDLLNGVLGSLTTTLATATGTALTGLAKATVGGTSAGACDILNLSLGPIDLNLLGLQVELDNCADGPVTVAITAEPGGGLLGDLLCDLNDLLNSKASSKSINALLGNITKAINKLV